MDYIELSCHLEPRLPGADILIAELAEAGFESFSETEDGFLAYMPAEQFGEPALQPLRDFDPAAGLLRYEQKHIPGQNWNSAWEVSFQPVVVAGTCCIRAPFHEALPGMTYDIVIEPRMSFGTGHHQTTSLMVEKLLTLPLEGRAVMDMGCGTGVLAILAALRGAGPVEGVDIEANAVENAIDNAARNGVPDIMVHKGDDRLLAANRYDLILANINKNVLLQALPAYSTALRENGELLLSGFFTTDAVALTEAAVSAGLRWVSTANREEWCLLQFQKQTI